MAEGAVLLRGFARPVEDGLLAALREIETQAPFRRMFTPGGPARDLPVRRHEAQRQAAAPPPRAWRCRGLGWAVAAVLPRRRAARRRRACRSRPPAHQSHLQEGALTSRSCWRLLATLHGVVFGIFLSLSQGEKGRLPIEVLSGLCSPRPGGPDMTATEATADSAANRTGIYLAVLPLVFTLG